jgi:chemotaxis regulatin CheY-phosphate phosphatase CheZ
MNDDDYWNVISGNTSATRELYDLIKDYGMYKEYNRKDDMAYSYSRGYYSDTRGDEVATTVLEAYASGVHFDTLLKQNKQVRAYWSQIQAEQVNKEKARERELERQRKLAEKRAAEQAEREEVMTKLSREELEAFGLVRKGKRR